MKGKGCPGRGNVTVVMHLMHNTKDLWMVHPPVQPVIISFMHQHSYGQTQWQPPPGVSIDVEINFSITLLPEQGQQRTRHSKDECSDHAPSYFFFKLVFFIGSLVDLSCLPFLFLPFMKYPVEYP